MLRSSSGKDLAYYDGVQKVFPIGRHALAYTGNETIQNLYFGAFVDAFVRQAPTDIPLTQLLSTFLAFADNTLPPQASTIVRQQSLVVAGYSGGQAMACYHNDKQTVGPKTTCGVGFVASDVTELDDIKPKLRSMTAVRVAPLAEQAIARYAKDKKHLDVGGPLHARHLTETTGRWIGEPPPRRPWNYLHDFAAAYWRGEIALTLAPGSTKAELDDMIGKADKWSRGVLQ